MPQALRFVDDVIAGEVGRPVGDIGAYFYHVVDVALGVGATGNGEADELERRGLFGSIRVTSEHYRSDLTGSDTACLVECDGESLTWIVQWRYLGKQ
jgi:hypothetical protein